MYRLIVSIPLIACLLACPLRCASCSAGVSVDAPCVQTACGCCQQESQQPQTTDCPAEDPADDCSCANCICEGATLESGPTFQEALQQDVSFDCWPVMAEFKLIGESTQLPTFDSPDRLFRPCGRDALIAHQVWLI